MKSLFIFDLHGTLAKDNEHAVLESSNASLAKHGRKERFTIKDMLRLQGKPWADYFRELCPDAGEEKIASMVTYAETFDDYVIPKYVKPMDYAVETLKEIKNRGGTILVISNTTTEALSVYFKWLGMTHLIDDKIGITDGEKNIAKFDVAENKGKKMQDYIKNRKFNKIFMIGDTEDDIKAGKIIGAETFYYNSQNQTCDLADYTINNLREMFKFID